MTLMRRAPLRARRPRDYTGTCQICSTTFVARVTRPQKYCSRECSTVGHVKSPLTCERCGSDRSRKHSSRRFCSRSCAAAATVKKRPLCVICQEKPRKLSGKTCGAACGYELRKQSVKPRPCPRCSTSFRPTPSALGRGSGKYCSLACYRAVAATRPAMVETPCAHCGVTFRRTYGAVKRTTRSFCSRKCSTAYNSGPTSAGWRGGKRRGYRGPGWVQIADQVRERDGYRCRRCGKAQDDEGRKLAVDHVIPYRSFETSAEANVPSNLVALCASCHGKKARAERLWLRGDVIEMWQYQVAVAEPWRTA